MILSGESITKLIALGTLNITPLPQIKECSVKIHLAGNFGKERGQLTELETYELQPKEFILATTLETISLPHDLAGLYDGWIGMSSCGVFTHVSSMLIDPGFKGQILLEIFNASDHVVPLQKGGRVGNLLFLEVR